MREFPYFCLDCEAVFYLARYEIGVTACPRCGRRRVMPLAAVFPMGASFGRNRQKGGKYGGNRSCKKPG